ncbi:hypothetical protein [Herpetosiphon sp. NSE202]|uniref:hypothetical protein n=1 Tax=Herpetosiphon sp. NSE202 TaxID=3351349 RepID=UPI00362AD3B7
MNEKLFWTILYRSLLAMANAIKKMYLDPKRTARTPMAVIEHSPTKAREWFNQRGTRTQ